MALSDKNRKIVWGKSGNRCAICKKEIVMESTSVDSESVVGDECHIVSKSINGPRYQENYPDGEHDLPKNIILLCKVHHKQIDDQLETFTEYLLLKVDGQVKSPPEFEGEKSKSGHCSFNFCDFAKIFKKSHFDNQNQANQASAGGW